MNYVRLAIVFSILEMKRTFVNLVAIFFFKSIIYYIGRDGSPCLQEELCIEDQYPNLFM